MGFAVAGSGAGFADAVVDVENDVQPGGPGA